MSAKGQLVVPEKLRKKTGFRPGDRFVAFPTKEGIVFKRIDVRAEFERVAKQMSKRFKEAGVTKKTIDEAVRWARQKPS